MFCSNSDNVNLYQSFKLSFILPTCHPRNFFCGRDVDIRSVQSHKNHICFITNKKWTTRNSNIAVTLPRCKNQLLEITSPTPPASSAVFYWLKLFSCRQNYQRNSCWWHYSWITLAVTTSDTSRLQNRLLKHLFDWFLQNRIIL